MKAYSAELLAALDAGEVITAGAVKIATATPLRAWSGYGPLTLNGESFAGVGQAGLVKATGGRLGGTEQAIELSLSGVDSDMLPLLDMADLKGSAVTIWRLMFDGSGSQLLGAHIFAAGRVDGLPVEETPGGSSIIRCRVESAARGSSRSTARLRSDVDQRQLDPLDGSLRWVTVAPGRVLYWGGKTPARASAVLSPQEIVEKAAGKFFG